MEFYKFVFDYLTPPVLLLAAILYGVGKGIDF